MSGGLCDANDVGMADTCCCCGGSASLGGTQHPIPGSVPALRYCSIDCHDDWEDYLAERSERAAAALAAERAESDRLAETWTGDT